MKGQQTDLFTEEELYVKGTLIVSIFYNEDNMYSVVRIRVSDTNIANAEKEMVVTGHFPSMQEEDTYVFFGKVKEHPRFGPQFIAERFKKELPQTKQGIIHYLSSDLFNGIGRKTAEKIVDTLGENAISKIMENESVLLEVPKLSEEKAHHIHEVLIEHQGLERIMVLLNDWGFGPQLSMKIYQFYQEKTVEVIEENPYQLVNDIEGVGFGKADELGRQLGLSGNHPDRIKAACFYTITQLSMQEGHVYADSKQLLIRVKELLEKHQPEKVDYADISKSLVELHEEGKIVGENKKVYLPSLYYSEVGIASSVESLTSNTEVHDQFPEAEFLLALGDLEERIGVTYAPSQKEAIQTALSSPIMILTGGPGTGKTTVIKGIVELYAELHGLSLDPDNYSKDEPFPIVLAAPTGRAAKRMTESTGLKAMTIHRLLGFNGQEDMDEEDDDRMVAGRLLIIDEMSMVDTWLANKLLQAVPESMQVILVGDQDQLPSVGPGQVLQDLLDAKKVPAVELTDIYRQEEGSSIIELAHHMKKGEVPETIRKPFPDRSFIPCRANQMDEVVGKIVNNAMKKGYTAKDIQVLAPMYRGPAGIDKLNALLQQLMNPNDDGSRKELKWGDIVYRIGDKVLQLVNQPESNVFNGDMGEVISIFYAKENTEKQDMILVSFDGVEVTYTRQDLNQITHAFCCSIHKSQGSEFPIVVLPVVKSYSRMLRRNLLYTAITRSSKFLIMCGEEDAFRYGVERKDDLTRMTSLKERLAGEQVEFSDDTDPFDGGADPMIGMEGVTPYDFLETSQG
ncbi:SF1B family DNA helicase RecD2 [Jeotgalibacillus haloalkalitolerans]|uniref:ATP-dependent RecD2 DNA helicase n=1 Tax=Jeotgalibacillus haloalkalitolerans TaxID=3104292 RepID=A0ABU5KM20_9BACL|nr:ATP-dependent RecD-like DNA helicase [Jeotgalibacillus sp. HH7-29]MDZ5712313.1 ATP-dependent RecD-like DNA helicase [Jeotgalibacillus sp. HH7-29]